MREASPHIKTVRREALLEILEPVLVAHGVELVELTFQTEGHGWVLRVAMEVPGATDLGGGVTVDLCAHVSRDLSAALDVADIISQRYSLEIASPGLDRLLRGQADFVRFTGKVAKVHLLNPVADGQVVLRGTIDSVEGDRVAMTVDGKPQSFPLSDVKEARLVFEFANASDKSKSRKKSSKKTQGAETGAEKPRGKPAAQE